MNTSALKKFAQETRKKLMQQIAAKLEFVTNNDTPELREKGEQVKKLKEELLKTSKEQLVDKVAYTWFNRFMALRFMDVNDFQPLGVRVISPLPGQTAPEILNLTKQGEIAPELKVNEQKVMDILDGRTTSSNPQNEAYKELLIASCNHLHTVLPFLFERINDYTELLLPDDLTSQFSIPSEVVAGMTEDDCKEVEIIGWLYQFYISEKKDEVFASKSAVKKEDIPAATQLFTPRWIVEYMVQNTVGKLWLQNKPNSKLREQMPYFIESPSVTNEDFLKLNSVEELKLLDQACGSGHILVYGFDLLYKIYEEEGYNPNEIPELIIKNNLFGFEIDERAAQLAGMALMMKARSYNRRFFRKDIEPNLLNYKDLKLNVYGHNGFKDVFKVSKDSENLLEIVKYGYRIAENIENKWKEDFLDKDTGIIVQVDRKAVKVKINNSIDEENYNDLILFGNQEILFFNDEIIDTFRLCGIELQTAIYHDLVNMLDAENFGSLIIPKSSSNEIKVIINKFYDNITKSDIFQKQKIEEIIKSLRQLELLSHKYHCIADNPPYMGGGNMNKALGDYVKLNYPDSKADLMACFMEAGLKALQPKGFLGMINQHSWMFLSSYEALRKKLLEKTFFDSLLHLGPRTFPEIGGEVVQNAAFTFWNTKSENIGIYFRLVDFDKTEIKRDKTIEAIQNPNCGWFHTAIQKDFKKIPGSPLGYWLSANQLKIFSKKKFIDDVAKIKVGLQTGENTRFTRFWHEIIENSFSEKWYPYNKGGEYRKWYGNQELVVNWKNDGSEIRNFKNLDGKLRSRPQNSEFYLRESISWSFISAGSFGVRYYPKGFVFDVAGSSIFVNDNLLCNLAYLNSKVCSSFLKVIAPTLNFQAGDIKSVPLIEESCNSVISELANQALGITKNEWNSKETSWDFEKNELIKHKSQELKESYHLLRQYWKNKFFQLHKNEEELNRQFIEIYGLQEELTPDVSLEEITILKEETVIENGQLVFKATEVFAQFMSYAVGCMFGRYSLDKEGLILANQGETLEDYLEKVTLNLDQLSFIPDSDNIIPVLDDDWFEDDIVGRFYAFLKASFGEANFQKNLAFVEECLGKDVRKYFTKEFYSDHIKRYKKRPIYWMFSSPKGSFSVLLYMHRYTPDLLSNILNNYLREFIEKLKSRKEHLDQIKISGSAEEQSKAIKEIDKIDKMLLDCQEYEREILFNLATERIAIDLDDGVLVNYNKFGKAIKEVSGLNDTKTKKKVREFEWIDETEIR